MLLDLFDPRLYVFGHVPFVIVCATSMLALPGSTSSVGRPANIVCPAKSEALARRAALAVDGVPRMCALSGRAFDVKFCTGSRRGREIGPVV